MLNLAVGAFGFLTTFKVSFERLVQSPLGLLKVPVPTVVPISRTFFEIDAKVVMTSAGTADTFDLTLYGLSPEVYALLEPQKTLVHIELGYADGDSEEVMTGLLTTMKYEAGECWYQARLSGLDYAYALLADPSNLVNKSYDSKSVGDIAKDLCQGPDKPASPVAANIKANGSQLKSHAVRGLTRWQALQQLARIDGLVALAKDGKFWMGRPADLGETRNDPLGDGATGKPLTAAGATLASNPLDGVDYHVAGLPALRPCDLVTIGTKQYRIESVTHELTRDGGYRCTGRALVPDASHDDAQKAGKPSAPQVARQLQQTLNNREQTRPAVNTGDVKDYTAGSSGGHTATLDTGHDAQPGMVSPSVQAPLSDNPVKLPDKPMASPFAYDNCGLVVPVYPGMRALLVNRWHDPNDAIVDGFLWTDQMTPPKNNPGDWWLCLPTGVTGNNPPSGSGVDDLIDKDGQRVIQVKGMKITVGSGLLNSVGTRPTPNSDESLTIETDQGAKVTIKGQQLELTDGQVKLTIGNGQVSIS